MEMTELTDELKAKKQTIYVTIKPDTCRELNCPICLDIMQCVVVTLVRLFSKRFSMTVQMTYMYVLLVLASVLQRLYRKAPSAGWQE